MITYQLSHTLVCIMPCYPSLVRINTLPLACPINTYAFALTSTQTRLQVSHSHTLHLLPLTCITVTWTAINGCLDLSKSLGKGPKPHGKDEKRRSKTRRREALELEAKRGGT